MAVQFIWRFNWSQNPVKSSLQLSSTNTIVTVETCTFFKHYSIFSTIKGITDLTFLERCHNCLRCHSPHLFCQESVPATMLCATSHSPSSKTITLLATQIPLFLLSAIQFFTSASRSGHFTILSCRPRYYFFWWKRTTISVSCHTQILHYT